MTEQERMQKELDDAEQEIHELKHVIDVERLAQKDMANTLNNYEGLIRDLTDALRAQGDKHDYERGFIDGMQKQMQSSVDKAVNRMAQPEQEPVGKLQEATAERAWFTIDELNAWADKKLSENPHWVMPKDEPERDEPPPQRTWVGLTKEQRYNILREWNRKYHGANHAEHLIDLVEAAHGSKENT